MKYKTSVLESKIQNTTFSIIGNYSTDEEAVKKIIAWERKNILNVYGKSKCYTNLCLLYEYPFICVRLIGHERPEWVLSSKCGACEEFSLLFAKMVNTINITVRSIHNHGEDHNWDEVWINNSWIIVDPANTDEIDVNSSFYEEGRHLNVSHVFALYPNGTEEDVTHRYTNTGKLIVYVTNNEGFLENISVLINSNSYRTDRPTDAKCITNSSGICEFNLGGTSYNIIALKDGILKYSDTKTIFLHENDTKEIELSPNKLDLIKSLPDYGIAFAFVIEFWILFGLIDWYVSDLVITATKRLKNH